MRVDTVVFVTVVNCVRWWEAFPWHLLLLLLQLTPVVAPEGVVFMNRKNYVDRTLRFFVTRDSGCRMGHGDSGTQGRKKAPLSWRRRELETHFARRKCLNP